MVVTLVRQYNVGERPTVILYPYINRHARPPDTTKTKDNTVHKIIYDNNTIDTAIGAWVISKMPRRYAIEPYNHNRGLGQQ